MIEQQKKSAVLFGVELEDSEQSVSLNVDIVQNESSTQSSVDSKAVTIVESESNNVRLFFPCNREDALLLLGSLCISEFFPNQSIKLPIQTEGLAIISSGLRSSEAEILAAGRPERFPILIQVRSEIVGRIPRVIGYEDIIGLTFQTQTQADDFRFRPVDEFDTEAFECEVNPAIFNWEGEARFSLRIQCDDSTLTIGRGADRLTAGVGALLTLGLEQEICRASVVRFLDGSMHLQLGEEEIDFVTACEIIFNLKGEVSHSKSQVSVVTSFAADMRAGPIGLIDDVVERYTALAVADGHTPKRIGTWADIARDTLKGRMALDGDQLSDDKSVILRGALLGTITERVDALSAFLEADKPSGPNVTTQAAFLLGLKQGLLSMSWRDKKLQLKTLSQLAKVIISALANNSKSFDKIFLVSRNETETTNTSVISIAQNTLADWTSKKEVVPDVVALERFNELSQMGYAIEALGRSRHSWLIRLDPKHLIEFVGCVAGDRKFWILRFYFNEDQKIKKAKDLAIAFCDRGMFWYPSTDEAGLIYLSCDLLSLPDESDSKLLSLTLDDAVMACVVPPKVSVTAKKVSNKKSIMTNV
jgi:hypothetical protein